MTETGIDQDAQDQFDEFAEEQGRGAAPQPVSLRSWRYAPDAWRWARRFDLRYLDMLFRTRSARIIPHSARVRFVEMGLPADVVDETLGRIRRLDQWSSQWIQTAQRYLGDSRRQTSALNIREAAQARQMAALCYHVAQILELGDDRTVRKCRAAAASLFTQTLPQLHPHVRHLWVPWRSTSLPAYFQMPDPVTDPVGIVVMLNGVSMSKEESFAWVGRFIERGWAVMLLDSPGTGEATGVADADAGQDDVLDGVFDLFAGEPMIDLRRVVVVGTSLGANQAVRVAARDRRILASVAVTPPYEPDRWIHRASPLLKQEISLMAVSSGDSTDLWDSVGEFSLEAAADISRQPMLVFGGGRDVIVPPTESQLLAERVGERATLVWYPGAGHCLYEVLDQWTFEAATWISAVADVHDMPEFAGDAGKIAAYAREILDATEYEPRRPRDDRDEDDGFTEYARLIPNDENPTG